MWFVGRAVVTFRGGFASRPLCELGKSQFHSGKTSYALNSANQRIIKSNIKPDLKPIKSKTRRETPGKSYSSRNPHSPASTARKGGIPKDTNRGTQPANDMAPPSKKQKAEPIRVEFTEAKPGKKLADLSTAIFTKNPYFVQSAPRYTDFKIKTLPEVAFVGRSNVGKSSVINALANRNRLVKTSKSPGHTKLLNTFSMADRLMLVDMPGYGFRSWDEWGTMSMDYFRESTRLRRIFVLIEATHGFKDKDQDLMSLLDGMGVSYQVVLTKTDKLSKTALTQIRSDIEAELSQNTISCFPQVLPVSASKKLGVVELRCAILDACRINSQ
ncbi:P-loop containing nucleoside triphosphate hydrolase protein [Basidiobolus meristosporus CBS 931.73]|uniref:GTP-binding protein 8 n=1 Tax=Basidiobolus meristosporus CBS 931.73 TaxID=1314790 RepID=A0A1Y1ZB18_9FUNG|nr:P-loop containing nucleoside triphosphate hydrolase protein [Basidiobolus meristosporus CBS 931.73]|eukprot:ORY07449.1 P-loop containing nucleoside triphosphate hydrolase protein [Basidiobolus meristosporus CBS 931.73]